ncbi:MAG TPA: TolC family protein [Terracidiphilus sp.]|nr:TolC family protein [Terracidiphilus sp.]
MKSVILFFFCILLCGGSQLHAQSPAGPVALPGGRVLLQIHAQADSFVPPLTLEEAERKALAANPEIAVSVRRVAVARAHVPAAGALEDPTAMYRAWGIPLQKPWNLNDAQNMFSISQELPGPGKRGLRTNIAESDLSIAQDDLAETRLQVRVAVRKAFDDLLRAQEELRIHDEHVGIAHQAIEAARIKYAVGKVPQQDILKAQVALTRLEEHMIRFDRDAEVAQARLNTLLGRSPGTPVRVAGSFPGAAPLPSAKKLEDIALHTRPDLLAAEQAARRSHAALALAHKAYVPDFTVSAGYMLMQPSADMRNSYMVEGSMSLPWLNRRKHNADIAESTARATEQDAELEALRNVVLGQIREALAEAQASQKLVHMYHDELRPQAEATLQASVIAYENDRTSLLDLLDSQMTVIDVDLSWLQASADLDARLSEIELATGAPLDLQSQPESEAKP